MTLTTNQMILSQKCDRLIENEAKLCGVDIKYVKTIELYFGR